VARRERGGVWAGGRGEGFSNGREKKNIEENGSRGQPVGQAYFEGGEGLRSPCS